LYPQLSSPQFLNKAVGKLPQDPVLLNRKKEKRWRIEEDFSSRQRLLALRHLA
jgi:hypothetical protein